MSRSIPIVSWMKSYDRSWLSVDVIAGLTVWGLIIPESMAYAGVAGLPPQFGLYTLLASTLAYAIFGTSRHLMVQPTSATAAVIASTVPAVLVTAGVVASGAQIDPAVYQAHAVAFTLVVGMVFLLASIARLGFITQFLSKPVLDGFITGLAVFVMVGQLYHLLGVDKPSGNTVQKFVAILRDVPDANWVTVALGVGGIVALSVLPRLNRRIPAGLVVLFASIALSSALDLQTTHGVEVVGRLPQGLPSPALPSVSAAALLAMIGPAIGVVLLAFSQSLGVAREYSDKHGYEIDPNQELRSFAVVNAASAVLGGQVAGGSMAPSAVNDGAGGRTQAVGIVAWGATVATVLFLTPLFESLPEAILAALILHALWHIVAARKLRYARMVAPTEFALGLATFAGVILIGVLQGMLIGLFSAVLLMVYRSSRPHLSELGRLPDVTGAYVDLERRPEALPIPGVLILRLDAPLYYANALTMRDEILRRVGASRPTTLLLDAGVQDDLDLTTADMLRSLIKTLEARGVALYVADLHLPVRDFATKVGLLDVIDENRICLTIDQALRRISAR